jgi:hypothetical protein
MVPTAMYQLWKLPGIKWNVSMSISDKYGWTGAEVTVAYFTVSARRYRENHKKKTPTIIRIDYLQNVTRTGFLNSKGRRS